MRKDLKGVDIYKEADLIVETTTFCNKSCKGCFFEDKKREKIILNHLVYYNTLLNLKKRSLIVLRGGEISTINDWFDIFVKPALDRQLIVIIESNGLFMEDLNYFLPKLRHKNIFLRISFDLMHIKSRNFRKECAQKYFFAKMATKKRINFGFYATGMESEQMINLLKGSGLEEYFFKFYFLKKYSSEKLNINGIYLRADGTTQRYYP